MFVTCAQVIPQTQMKRNILNISMSYGVVYLLLLEDFYCLIYDIANSFCACEKGNSLAVSMNRCLLARSSETISMLHHPLMAFWFAPPNRRIVSFEWVSNVICMLFKRQTIAVAICSAIVLFNSTKRSKWDVGGDFALQPSFSLSLFVFACGKSAAQALTQAQTRVFSLNSPPAPKGINDSNRMFKDLSELTLGIIFHKSPECDYLFVSLAMVSTQILHSSENPSKTEKFLFRFVEFWHYLDYVDHESNYSNYFAFNNHFRVLGRFMPHCCTI